jgi:hypothetical protein
MRKKERSLPKKAGMGFSIDGVVDLRRSPNLLVLGFAESLIEGIAGPAHAQDRITFAAGRQRFAKTSYVDIDRSIGDVDGWPPKRAPKGAAEKRRSQAARADIRAAGIPLA